MRASSVELRRLLAELPALYRLRTRDALLRHAIAMVARVVPADLVAFDEFRGGRIVRQLLSPADVNLPEHRDAFEQYFHEHPVVNHQRRTGDRRPVKLSDLVSRRAYHRLGLYAELFRNFDIESQIAFPVNGGRDHLLGIALARSRGDFSEAERDLLAILQPQLARAWRNARTVSRILEREGIDADDVPLDGSRGAGRTPKHTSSLTRRESEILHWVGIGKSNAEIGQILDVSRWTVKKHLENVYSKLGVTSRAAAVAAMLRHEH